MVNWPLLHGLLKAGEALYKDQLDNLLEKLIAISTELAEDRTQWKEAQMMKIMFDVSPL